MNQTRIWSQTRAPIINGDNMLDTVTPEWFIKPTYLLFHPHAIKMPSSCKFHHLLCPSSPITHNEEFSSVLPLRIHTLCMYACIHVRCINIRYRVDTIHKSWIKGLASKLILVLVVHRVYFILNSSLPLHWQITLVNISSTPMNYTSNPTAISLICQYAT